MLKWNLSLKSREPVDDKGGPYMRYVLPGSPGVFYLPVRHLPARDPNNAPARIVVAEVAEPGR